MLNFIEGSTQSHKISVTKETYTKHDIDSSNVDNNKIMNKIRKTNFHFGSDKAGYGQTTQQYNNKMTERLKGLNFKQKPALDREKLQITHFIMGK